MNTTAGSRRVRYGLSTAVLLIAATITCLLAGILGSRLHTRWDVTSNREFTLSERTKKILGQLDETATIIVSADLASLDRRSRQQVDDLLAEFERQSPKIRRTWINTGSASAEADLALLLGSLSEPFASELVSQREILSRLADESAAMVQGMTGLSDRLKTIADLLEARSLAPSPEDRTHPRNQAGLVRTIASRLEAARESLHQSAQHEVVGVALPTPDVAQEAASLSLTEAARASEVLAEYARALLAVGSEGELADSARAMQSEAKATRDAALLASDQLSRLKVLDPLIVARVLQATNAVLVTSKRGSVALDFATIFPAGTQGADAGGQDVLFAGEQLITTALTALSERPAPIVVFVHAHTVTLLDEKGEPTPVARSAYRKLFDRLRFTRTTPAEWAVATAPLKPDLSGIDPTGGRPVVWIVLGAPSRVGVDVRQPGALTERSSRINKLGAAVRSLIDGGEHVLVCVEPSDLPSLGETDPIAGAMEPLALSIDSGRPLLRRESSPQGPLTYSYLSFRRASDDHPIGQAVDGLGIVMPWATSVEIPEARSDVRAWPLLQVDAASSLWGESQWMLIRDLVARGLARPLGPMLLAESPMPDPKRDLVRSEGRLTVAAAIERDRSAEIPTPRSAQADGPQRLVVVASPAWLDDGYTQASEDVQGRRVLLFPGNLELLDASIAWLAGRDEEIAPGPQSRDLPRIQPMSEQAILMLRLLLILGLPALVLIAGALLRLIRG